MDKNTPDHKFKSFLDGWLLPNLEEWTTEGGSGNLSEFYQSDFAKERDLEKGYLDKYSVDLVNDFFNSVYGDNLSTMFTPGVQELQGKGKYSNISSLLTLMAKDSDNTIDDLEGFLVDSVAKNLITGGALDAANTYFNDKFKSMDS